MEYLNSSFFLSMTTFIYGLAVVFYAAEFAFKRPAAGVLATITTVLAVLANLSGFLLRWNETYQVGMGHAPLSNLYESLIFFAFAIGVVYLTVEFKFKTRALGTVAVLVAFIVLAYASLTPAVEQQIQPLIPALQSNWLTAHVMTCFLGYAAFAVAFAISVIYMVLVRNRAFLIFLFVVAQIIAVADLYIMMSRDKMFLVVFFILAELVGLATLYLAFAKKQDEPNQDQEAATEDHFLFFPPVSVLDELIYQTVAFGFFFLSIGIITGAVWANTAWGRYWGWDPKETWSLITWFIYATLLHARLIRGWQGTRIVWISIIGFAAVIFTYFGVNLLPGLHSYL